jgi:hypothetical protein
MTALTTPFSSQNTTIEIFEADTDALTTAIASALALSTNSLRQAALKVAYDAYFVGSLSKTIGGTGILATAPAQADGYFSGTWTKSGQSGTFSSTGSTATAITANFYLSSGTPASIDLAATDLTFNTGNADKGTITSSGAVTGLLFSGATGYKIGKITAAGDTGKTYAGISAKLLNESGTMKAKGSSDEGDFTIDFLNTPGDQGQLAMTTAFNDESANANRVFRIIHGSSNDGTITNGEMVYFVGMVTELKKTRGAIDNYVSVKSKISIQNGLYEYNPT